jgi:hypothetical protein
VKEASSFSEEKEAKRLFPIGPKWLLSLWPYGEKFFGSFFQERTLLFPSGPL